MIFAAPWIQKAQAGRVRWGHCFSLYDTNSSARCTPYRLLARRVRVRRVPTIGNQALSPVREARIT